jgi:hypothetical protein
LRRLVGFGALDLGAKGQFYEVGGHSAALWFHGGDTPAGAFDDAQLHVWPGGHTGSYWRAHMAQYFRFYADACG